MTSSEIQEATDDLEDKHSWEVEDSHSFESDDFDSIHSWATDDVAATAPAPRPLPVPVGRRRFDCRMRGKILSFILLVAVACLVLYLQKQAPEDDQTDHETVDQTDSNADEQQAAPEADSNTDCETRSTRFPDAPLEPECAEKNIKHAGGAGSVGDVSSFQFNPGTSDLYVTAGRAVVRLTFVAPGILRVRLGPDGQFTDPTAGEIIELPTDPVVVTFEARVNGFSLTSSGLVVSGTMKPLLLTLALPHDSGFWHDGIQQQWDTRSMHLWQETSPMAWDETSTWQTLTTNFEAKVYGCGMQNGFYDHTGRVVDIKIGGGWDEGGRANPSPFFMTSLGWGMFRNTFSPGRYHFNFKHLTHKLDHTDRGLDAFFFADRKEELSMKSVLGLYTSVVGRPFVPPVWGMWLGDADCYNNKRHGFNTPTAVDIAETYTKTRMPRGWMLVNDGYGCWYTSRPKLTETRLGLAKHGVRMGLWTSTGLANATWEIGTAGSRVIKTDVAWVGRGYDFGLKAVKEAARLIVENSDSRPFTWTVCGWAGTQKYAVVWTGDSRGSWEYIRMQIPTVIGSGLSGLAHASGDVDGIFDGSAETYVRDLQWKTFLTVTMTMSGWAAQDKQPWTYGEPYTSYNREALQLRARLTPYMYSLAYEAHRAGVPPVRAMSLEFPGYRWELLEEKWPSVDTSLSLMHQFMSGPFFLVAPVFEKATTRSGILFPPNEEWVDYNTGDRIRGPKVLDGHPAPLDRLPVFVRAGAIVPLWPLMDFVGQRPLDELTLDVYPTTMRSRFNRKTSFTLYEDDGLTRKYLSGAVAKQVFDVSTVDDGNLVVVGIGKSVGSYEWKLDSRRYMLQVHLSVQVASVHLSDGAPLPNVPCSELSSAKTGWSATCAFPTGGSTVFVNAGTILASDQTEVHIKLYAETEFAD